MKRVFLALELAPEVRLALAQAVRWMDDYARRLSVVPSDNYHLTIQFLGPVEEELLPKILATLQEKAKRWEPFDFTLDDWGVFPTTGRPAVFWIGAEPVERITALAKKCATLMESFNYFPEKREFHPHVTLARTSRGPAPVNFMREWKQMPVLAAPLAVSVDHLTVFESVTAPSGAVYKPLGVAEFKR